jgi:glutamyl-tRNA synthetase
MRKLMPLIHTRIKTFGDFMQLCDFFFINDLHLTPELLCPKNSTPELLSCLYQSMIWSMDEQEDWSGAAFEKASHEVADAFGVHHKKIVMQALFPAIMGKRQGPPLFDSVTLLGKDRTRVRLLGAIETLGGISNKKMDALKKGWGKRNCKDLAAAPVS